jgi:hypothetical protein
LAGGTRPVLATGNHDADEADRSERGGVWVVVGAVSQPGNSERDWRCAKPAFLCSFGEEENRVL